MTNTKCFAEPISVSIAAGYLVHEADRRNKEEWNDKVIAKRRRELENVREQIHTLRNMLEDKKLSAKSKIHIAADIRLLEEEANDIHQGMYENIGEPPNIVLVWLKNAWNFLTCKTQESF